MKALALYHPNSEHSRSFEEYIGRLNEHAQNTVDLLSLETREGAATASLYDVVQYPAIIVVDEQGRAQKQWQGSEVPLIDEIMGYLAA